MTNFKVGQKVVCLKENNVCVISNRNLKGPKKDDIVTITTITEWRGTYYLSFAEFPPKHGYEDYNFRPLDHQFAENVIAMICSQPETVEV